MQITSEEKKALAAAGFKHSDRAREGYSCRMCHKPTEVVAIISPKNTHYHVACFFETDPGQRIRRQLAKLRRIKTEAIVCGDGHPGGMRSHLPGIVRAKLGAEIGDTLVYEEGCEQAHVNAVRHGRGRYFVIYKKPARHPLASTTDAAGPELPPLDPLDVAVRKRQDKSRQREVGERQ